MLLPVINATNAGKIKDVAIKVCGLEARRVKNFDI